MTARWPFLFRNKLREIAVTCGTAVGGRGYRGLRWERQ